MSNELIIVTGMGAMGVACARRLGGGRQLLLADNDNGRLEHSINQLQEDGFNVAGLSVDLGNPASITEFCERIKERGVLRALVHTAAVSPTQAYAERIYKVNLEGTARLLEGIVEHLHPSTVGIVISSMAAQFVSLSVEQEAQLATADVGQLAALALQWENAQNSNQAYLVAKRGNQLRVEREALRWARHGARLLSISPGIISTAQGRQEVREQPQVAKLVDESPVGRIGTPEDIAAAVEWLSSPAASFICGTDLRVDGGTIAALRWSQ